jgi:hypothetical protein
VSRDFGVFKRIVLMYKSGAVFIRGVSPEAGVPGYLTGENFSLKKTLKGEIRTGYFGLCTAVI